jgi:hypothetical protein
MSFTALVQSTERYGTLQLASGEQQVALLELYTSEGCSSCPPADRWLSGLKTDARLWHDFVPVALHVDYWNYIGWDDRFASNEFSDRQRDYVQSGAARAAYTPGFFSRGEEWLGWRNDMKPARNRKLVGNLNIHLDGTSVNARFDPSSDLHSELVLHIALLGMRLETDVRAGENRGKILEHDFVVLDLQSVPMTTTDAGFDARARLGKVDNDIEHLALAAWVSTTTSPTPLQSVGGYLPSPK